MSVIHLVVTGTDTGVGKTFVTSLLLRFLGDLGHRVIGFKPVSSGDRSDALALKSALPPGVALDVINPWFFRAPISPARAAANEGLAVTLQDTLLHLRRHSRGYAVAITEGAGGLLSPLGKEFDTRDLIRRLRATPVVVVPNRLGAVNQTRLVLEALPATARARAQIVLVAQQAPDASAGCNLEDLRSLHGAGNVHSLPRISSRKNGSGDVQAALQPMLRRFPGHFGDRARTSMA